MGSAQHNLCATLKGRAVTPELLDQRDDGVPLYSACTLIPRGRNPYAAISDDVGVSSQLTEDKTIHETNDQSAVVDQLKQELKTKDEKY